MPQDVDTGPEPERFMRRAIAIAVESAATAGGPFGALVVRDGRILAEGTNQVTATNDPTAHAEVVAIRRACAADGRFDLAGATLYASCEPCPLCYSAAMWARIERIYFAGTRDEAAAAGFDDRRFHAEIALDPADRALPLVPLLHGAAHEPFDAWLANPDRIPY